MCELQQLCAVVSYQFSVNHLHLLHQGRQHSLDLNCLCCEALVLRIPQIVTTKSSSQNSSPATAYLPIQLQIKERSKHFPGRHFVFQQFDHLINVRGFIGLEQSENLFF